MPLTPELRLRIRCDAPVRRDGAYVLYWMTSARRTRASFALERAAAWARELRRPLVVLEALRCDYLHASDRIHRFVLEGMRDNEHALTGRGVLYHAYVETRMGGGKGLLAALGARACVVVGDESPAFFLPRMLGAAARSLAVRFETVDGTGLVPLRASERAFPTAHGFRRFVQRVLPEHLRALPLEDSLSGEALPKAAPGTIPDAVRSRWPRAPLAELLARGGLEALPVDHTVERGSAPGGSVAGRARLAAFVETGLAAYDEARNELREGATSALSPYLHFGHLSPHEVLAAIARREGFAVEKLGRPTGKRTGYWGLSPGAEAYLDQLVTWREVAYNAAARMPGYDTYPSLPSWARTTLEKHRPDPRAPVYARATLDAARTHDALWNAAQMQLRREGCLYNYLRMLWGKKILEWSAQPEEALATMLWLNDRYALDGRDPSSVAGVAWVLGRYDRAWGPERPVYGTVRFMSSASATRKLKVRDFVERYAPAPAVEEGR